MDAGMGAVSPESETSSEVTNEKMPVTPHNTPGQLHALEDAMPHADCISDPVIYQSPELVNLCRLGIFFIN